MYRIFLMFLVINACKIRSTFKLTILFLVAGSKEIRTGSGNSSASSGSGVLVPSVDDKDVEWDDDDDDLDLNDDMDEEEVKKIMQTMAAKKQSGDDGTGDPDVSHRICNIYG